MAMSTFKVTTLKGYSVIVHSTIFNAYIRLFLSVFDLFDCNERHHVTPSLAIY